MKLLINLIVSVVFSMSLINLNAQDVQNETPSEAPQEKVEGLFEYSPKSNRDPFVSPFDLDNLKQGKARREGIHGMMFTEIVLQGIITSEKRGYEALVMGNDNKVYWITEGTELYDGKVIEIFYDKNPDTGEVDGYLLFRQEVNDPNQVKPYRDIKKYLNK